jgi:predicted N-acetyltransferase YhbS
LFEGKEACKLDIYIRVERSGDFEQVDALLDHAFRDDKYSRGDEGHMIRMLRESDNYLEDLSIVAERHGRIIGYVMLVPASVNGFPDALPSLVLAPVAVLQEYQGRAVGSRLVEFAIERARDLGYGSIFVFGHPAYYPRFGFKPASLWGITAPFEVPDESFMSLELVDGALEGVHGLLDVSPIFQQT